MKTLIAFILLGLTEVAYATAPTLPQLSVTTTDPSALGSYRRTVDCTASAGNAAAQATCLENAVADAEHGDLIETEPGATLDKEIQLIVPGGTILTPSSAGATAVAGSSGAGAVSGSSGASASSATGTVNNFVTIRPSGFDSAVSIGTRATSANTASMTKLRATGEPTAGQSNPTITIANGAKYWWISGLEVVPKAGDTAGTIVQLTPNDDDPANRPSYMVLDRVYIHGDTSGSNGGPGALHGTILNGSYAAVINSTIDDIKSTSDDTQAITAAFGPGPFHIENNLLGATGENVLFETPTGERISSVTVTGGTTATRSSNFWGYDVVGKTFNLAGGSTATVLTRNSDTVITLETSVSNGTAVGYVNYDRSGNPGYFPGDIKILRNYFRKKAAWNISDPTFERSSGGDTGLTSMTIHASDNTKIAAGTYGGAIAAGTQIFITSSSPWISGYAYCTSIDGSGNAVMNRALGTVGSTVGTARKKYNVKNALEFKSGARTLVEGNVFDGSWAGGQNFILTLTPRYTNSPAGDITIQYNKFVNVFGILVVTASETGQNSLAPGPYLQNHRVLLQHNLFKDVNMSSTNSTYIPGVTNVDTIEYRIYADTGTTNGFVGGPTTMDDFQFLHNTVAGASSAIDGYFMRMGSGEDPAGFTKGKRFVFKDNIIFTPTAGLFGSAFSGSGTTALGQVSESSAADVRTVTKNLLIETSYTGSDLTSPDTGNVAVTHANLSTINFTNYAGGDYTIASGTYATWASDGTPVGADIGTLNTKISGVE